VTSLYLFDKDQKLIKIIAQKHLIQARQKEQLQDNDLAIDRFTAEYKLSAFKQVEDVHYFAVKDLDNPNQFHMYFVTQPITNENTVILEGKQLGHKELKHFIIQEIHPQNRQAEFMLNQALQGTGWRVGYVAETVQASQHFYFTPVLEALKVISGLFGIELVFKVEISGQKITDKWVEAYNRRGAKTMKRFTHGSNLLSVKETIERSNVYTALIGRGRGEETETGGFGRRISFEEVEWSVAHGDPVDKPLGQNYVEVPSATEEYGINMPDGSKVPAMGVVELEHIEDPEELLRATYEELINRIRPSVLYSTTVADIGKVELGEVVGIHRYDLNVHYETRIISLERNYLFPQRTPVELGERVFESRIERETRVQRTISTLSETQNRIRQEVNYVVQAADGMNTITYGNTEPDRKRVGDSWVRDHPTQPGYTQWLMWNGDEWEITSDSYERHANKRAIEAQQEEIQEAKSSADAANQQINDAIQNAGFTSLTDTISHKVSVTAFNTLKSTVDGTIQRIGDAEGNITQIEANVNGLQTTVASKASQTEVTQLATGFNVLSTNFNNLEIGGRNYASTEKIASIYRASGSGGTLNPNHSECPYGFYSVNVQAETTVFRIDNIITGNGLWTVSFDIRGSQNAAVSQRVSIADSPEQTLRTNTTNTWRRVSATFNVTDYTEEKAYLDFRPTWAHLFVRNLVVEKGNKATDWTPAPEDMASQAQLSVLNDQINLRVAKGEVMSQINIEAGRTLIDTDRLYLSANTTVFGGSAFIPNAAIESLSADKLTAGTINAAEINVIGLNTSDIVGLNSEFIRSQWNSGAGGNVSITGDGLRAIASDGSQALMQNGVFLTRNTSGATLGYIGYDQTGSNPFYTITTTIGSNFRIRNGLSGGSFRNAFEIYPGSNETYIRTQNNYITGVLNVLGTTSISGALNLSSISIVGHAINFTGLGGYIDVQSNSNMRVNALTNLVLRSRGSNALLFDATHGYMTRTLSMEGYNITNAGGYGTRSERKYKDNIVPFENATEIINEMNIYSYLKEGRYEVGLIADEAPWQVLSDDNTVVQLYSLTSIIGQGLKETITEVDQLKARVQELEDEIQKLKEVV
jgi:phage minor structural protein